MTRVATVLLVVVLAGCGGHKQSKAEQARMNAEFARIDYAISNMTLGAPPANQAGLAKLTREYVDATHKYASALGDNAVKERLATEAEQLKPWCIPCVVILDQAREKY